MKFTICVCILFVLLLGGILYASKIAGDASRRDQLLSEQCVVFKYNKDADSFLKNKCYRWTEYENENR